MNRLLLVFALTSSFSSFCDNANAQEEKTPVALAPEAKYSVATNPFRQNWEVSLGLQGLSYFSNQENGLELSGNPFKSFRTQLGLAAAVSKWFSPEIALRTKLSGVWGRSVSTDNKDLNSVKHLQFQEDVMLNLSNIIYDYKADRTWNVIPYGGIGFARNFTHKETALTLSLGIVNTYRITDKLKAFCNLSFTIAGDEFDNRPTSSSKNIFKNHDRWFGAEIGVTLELGQNKWKKAVDMDNIEVVPWNETQRELKHSRKRVKALEDQVAFMESQPKENVIVNHIYPTQEISIFFEIGSAELTHRGQLENVKKLVQTVKDENKTLVVTGYADSHTGNAQLNEKLSEQRAKTIAKELIEMGVSPTKIKTVVGGGVSTLNPIPANRRVVVTLED